MYVLCIAFVKSNMRHTYAVMNLSERISHVVNAIRRHACQLQRCTILRRAFREYTTRVKREIEVTADRWRTFKATRLRLREELDSNAYKQIWPMYLHV